MPSFAKEYRHATVKLERDYAMTYDEILVTPEIAIKFLESNTVNRRIKEKIVRVLARDMSAGNWYANGQTISFYEDGTLCDGQHRLHAVVMSETSQRFIVVRGIEKKAAKSIDTQTVRSISDRLRISTGDLWFTSNKAAIIRFAMWVSGYTSKATADMFIAVASPESRTKIDFVTERIQRRKGIAAAPFLAAVASTYGHVDYDRLEQFCEALKTGICHGDQDTAAIRAKELALTFQPRCYRDRFGCISKCNGLFRLTVTERGCIN